MVIVSMLAVAAVLQDAQSKEPRESAKLENRYYELVTLPLPEDEVLEIGGICLVDGGRAYVSTRRGEIWAIDEAFAVDPADVRMKKVAEGLQEPLGLHAHENGWIYAACRAELVRMRDSDGDDVFDIFETVCDGWSISGNYHEYNFGPRPGVDGTLWITTNKPFGGEPFGRAKWRGFALRITLDGEMKPMCAGLRSPAGLEAAPWGELFYTDNQGEWCGASKLSLLEPGSFHGHPWGVFSCEDPLWTWPHPGESPNRVFMPEVQAMLPAFRLPAVWFPYDEMGRSPAGFAWDTTAGAFGPFDGQVFVTDQYDASVMRVHLEKVGGHWQGACFPFRKGLTCGALRCRFGPDGSLLVGMTNRGWGSRGSQTEGIQRIVWTGETPFEIHHMRARVDGFEVHFTKPADLARLADLASYGMESYTYELHSDYGSPEVDKLTPEIVSATPSEDGLSVRLVVEPMRAGYVHELRVPELATAGGELLLHPRGYYTLARLPRR